MVGSASRQAPEFFLCDGILRAGSVYTVIQIAVGHLLEHDPDSFRIRMAMWNKEIVRDLSIPRRRVVQLHVEAAEDRGQGQIGLGCGQVDAHALPCAFAERHEVLVGLLSVVQPSFWTELCRIRKLGRVGVLEESRHDTGVPAGITQS